MDLMDLALICTSKHNIYYQEKNLDVRPIKVCNDPIEKCPVFDNKNWKFYQNYSSVSTLVL